MKLDTPSPFSVQSVPASRTAANDNGDVGFASELDELARAAAQGDLHAIGELANRYGASLLAVARLRAANEQDAEEAMQELLANLAEGRARGFPPRRGRAFQWLMGLMGSIVRKHDADEAAERRARRRLQSYLSGPDVADDEDVQGRPIEEPGSLFDPYEGPREEEEEDG